MTDPFLLPNRYVDSDHPEVMAFAQRMGGGKPKKQAAIDLFYAVRDGFRYNPWNVSFLPEDFTASGVLRRHPPEGHCIDKALVLAASARALGIPSRLHFANVRNHVGTGRLEEKLGTDLLVYHGYTELWLNERWVAATPAFNAELCRHLGVAPLEFDGENDAIFQEFDRGEGGFMEYVEDHGSHEGLPFDDMIAAWKFHYQKFVGAGGWPVRPEGV